MIIGVSTDTLDLQQQFTTKEKLNFPLGADTDAKVAKAFGAMGKKNAQRMTFVIDKMGNVKKTYMVTTPGGHPEEVLMWVKANLAEKK